MNNKPDYLFKSQRLGFRSWSDSDLEAMTALNNDPQVMRYYPSLQDSDTTMRFINKMKTQFEEYQYCYYRGCWLATEAIALGTRSSPRRCKSVLRSRLQSVWDYRNICNSSKIQSTLGTRNGENRDETPRNIRPSKIN